MALTLSQSANLAAKIYFQVAAVIDNAKDPEEFTDAIYFERDAYLLDFHDYDIWTEDPEEWERENGRRPHAPLTSQRRADLKAAGFYFKINGDVTYKGVPCDEWVKKQDGV